MYEYLLSKLTSTAREQILDGLYELSGIVGDEPTGKVKQKVIDHLKHSDADIRETAVRVAGIHWPMQDAYKTLVGMLNGEERDQTVLFVLATALPCFLKKNMGNKNEISHGLARIVLNVQHDPKLRATAYLSLLKMHGRIDIREYAAKGTNLNNVNIDIELVNELSKTY